jgi:hypothetical protein
MPPQEAVNPTYLLAWIPEALLNEKGSTEWDKFVKIEENAVVDENDEGAPPASQSSISCNHCVLDRCSSNRPAYATTRIVRILCPVDFDIFARCTSADPIILV